MSFTDAPVRYVVSAEEIIQRGLGKTESDHETVETGSTRPKLTVSTYKEETSVVHYSFEGIPALSLTLHSHLMVP